MNLCPLIKYSNKPPIDSKMLFDVKTLGLRDSYYNRTGMNLSF